MASATREHFAKLAELVEAAKNSQVHLALGFPSWTAYLADALGGQMELSSDSRREVVALMAGHGMSERAISAAVGVSQSTVHRDLGQVIHDDSPADAEDIESKPAQSVTGIDGKNYRPKKPKRPTPTDTQRRATFREDMLRKAIAVLDAVDKLNGLTTRDGGDLFADYAKRKTVAADDVRKRLARCIGNLQEMLDQLPGPNAGAHGGAE